MSETVTITKEQLRLAVLHGWKDCIPRAHMSLDGAWDWLQTPDTPGECQHMAGDDDYGYSFTSWDAWGTEEDG